jgi:hypothetical protein
MRYALAMENIPHKLLKRVLIMKNKCSKNTTPFQHYQNPKLSTFTSFIFPFDGFCAHC